MIDFNNCLHIIGGAGFAFLAILIVRKKAEAWATILIGILIGTMANVFWELVVDTYGWITWFGRASAPDPLDVYRGCAGSIVMAIIYLFYLRYKTGTWRF